MSENREPATPRAEDLPKAGPGEPGSPAAAAPGPPPGQPAGPGAAPPATGSTPPSETGEAAPPGTDAGDAKAGAPADVEALRRAVIDAIRTCYDPEIPVNIYEMGLVYEVEVTPEGGARIVMTLTSPMCPVAETLPFEVENKVREVPGIRDARVEVTWDPPWDPSMMSDAARLELGMM